ncbi:MAG: hypothetical protein WBI27_02010 [Thermoanaerobaculia bacterium]
MRFSTTVEDEVYVDFPNREPVSLSMAKGVTLESYKRAFLLATIPIGILQTLVGSGVYFAAQGRRNKPVLPT